MESSEKTVRKISESLGEPGWLLNERLRAWHVFQKLNEMKKSEEIRIPEIQQPGSTKFHEFCANWKCQERRFVPEHARERATFATFDRISNTIKNKKLKITDKAGIRIDSLHDLLCDNARSSFAKTIFMNRHFKPDESPEAAFANAFFTECNLFWAGKRGNVKIEAGGKAGGTETGGSAGGTAAGVAINFFILGENAAFECEISSGNPSSSSFLLSEFYVPENAKCRADFFAGGNAVVRNAGMLFGENSDIDFVERFVGNGDDRMSLNSSFFHIAKSSKSNYESRGVLKEKASATVSGISNIKKGASGSSSFINEKILLLDKGARATADPRLEIGENDVTAGHSASVSEIGEEQLFYLMSRGFSEEEAKKLVVGGFVGKA